jgi:hypothetical protein
MALLCAGVLLQYSKLMFNHLDEQFIEHRRVLLEAYLQKLVAIRDLSRQPVWLTFFGV